LKKNESIYKNIYLLYIKVMNNIKIVAVGDGAVGKTSVLLTYTTNSFSAEYVPTVFDNYGVNLMIDGNIYNLSLWDTAGQEDYDKIRPLSYANTDIFMVCYSIISETSFQNVKNKWRPELAHHSPNTPMILVGLKNDLRGQTKEVVDEEVAKKYATDNGFAGHYLCSAVTQDGLKTLFDSAVTSVINAKNKKPEGKACCVVL
jgi:small GTP-binding protein